MSGSSQSRSYVHVSHDHRACLRLPITGRAELHFVVEAQALDFCHGSAGGGTFALQTAGAKVVGGCEINRARFELYQALHGHGTECMDAVECANRICTQVAMMLLCGPCQCFIALGGQAPDGGQDERECVQPVVKSISTLSKNRRPVTLVMENVLQMMTVEGGNFFGRVADELHTAGYHLAIVVMYADAFGLPIRRKRLYVAALPSDIAVQRFVWHMQTSDVCSKTVFADVCEKDPALWDDDELRIDVDVMRRALRRSSLGWFTIVSCHYQGILQTLITRGGETHCLGYGTYVVWTNDDEQYRKNTVPFEDLSVGNWKIRTLSCREVCKLQGSPVDTTFVHGEGKTAHIAWGEAVAVPCAKTVCNAALQATGHLGLQRPQSTPDDIQHNHQWPCTTQTVGIKHPRKVVMLHCKT